MVMPAATATAPKEKDGEEPEGRRSYQTWDWQECPFDKPEAALCGG
jgi:hypothetical protein